MDAFEQALQNFGIRQRAWEGQLKLRFGAEWEEARYDARGRTGQPLRELWTNYVKALKAIPEAVHA